MPERQRVWPGLKNNVEAIKLRDELAAILRLRKLRPNAYARTCVGVIGRSNQIVFQSRRHGFGFGMHFELFVNAADVK